MRRIHLGASFRSFQFKWDSSISSSGIFLSSFLLLLLLLLGSLLKCRRDEAKTEGFVDGFGFCTKLRRRIVSVVGLHRNLDTDCRSIAGMVVDIWISFNDGVAHEMMMLSYHFTLSTTASCRHRPCPDAWINLTSCHKKSFGDSNQ